jgi:hypothetical protein
MRDEDWFVSYIRCLAMLLDGRVMTEWADTGELIRDDAMLVLLNACWEEIPFTLPAIGEAINWHVLVDTTSGATASVILSRHAAFMRCGGGLWRCCRPRRAKRAVRLHDLTNGSRRFNTAPPGAGG